MVSQEAICGVTVSDPQRTFPPGPVGVPVTTTVLVVEVVRTAVQVKIQVSSDASSNRLVGVSSRSLLFSLPET